MDSRQAERYVNLDLEKAVIGKLLLHADAYDSELAQVDSDWFVGRLHPDIIFSLKKCKNRERTALVTYTAEELAPLQAREVTTAYLKTECMQADGVKQEGLQEDLTTLQTLHNKRKVVEATESLREAMRPATDTLTLMTLLEEKLGGLHRGIIGNTDHILSPEQTAEYYRKAAEAGEDPGKETGFFIYDDLYEFLAPSTMHTILGRPKEGKSVLVLQMAEAVARNVGPVLFVSVEMDREQMLARRAVMTQSQLGFYPTDNQRNPPLMGNGGHWYSSYFRKRVSPTDPVFLRVLEEWKKRELYFLDNRRTTVPAISGEIRRLNYILDKPLAAVFIDYLNILEGVKGDEYQKTTELSHQLHYLARDHRIAVVVAAQLNRNADKEDREPELHDIRGSGAVEQDSDTCTFIWRPDGADRLRVIASKKNRHGVMKRMQVRFSGERMLFKPEAPPKEIPSNNRALPNVGNITQGDF